MAHALVKLAVPIGAVAVVLSIASYFQHPVQAASQLSAECGREHFLPIFNQLNGRVSVDVLSELQTHASFSEGDITNDNFKPRDERGLFVLVTRHPDHNEPRVRFVEKKIQELPRPLCEADVTLESGGYVVMGVTRTSGNEVYLATAYARRPHPAGTT